MPKEIDVGANLAPLTRPSPSPQPADDASGAATPGSSADTARPASTKRRQPAGKKAGTGATSSSPARRNSPSKQRRTATPAPAATDAPAASTGPRILAPATQAEAWRLTAYLHPDEKRMLALKQLDDGADSQARLRAMFAVYRSNSRFQQMVDRLAAAEPKRQGPRRNG